MSQYNLVQRASVTISDTATSPLKINLVSPIKLASSFLITTIRDARAPSRLINFGQQIDDGDTSPLFVQPSGGPWDVARTTIRGSWRQDRASQGVGVTWSLSGANDVRLTWPGTLGVGETIDVELTLIEMRSLGASAQIVNEAGQDKLVITWAGTINPGENIFVDYAVVDLENLGDDLKEILFREQRILAYLGENSVEDGIVYNDAGNAVSYRLRCFDSKANAEAATLNIPDADPLETGELARFKAVVDVNIQKNDRIALVRTLELLATTPGVD